MMMDFTRAQSNGAAPQMPLRTLTTKQRAIVEAVDAFERAAGEPCSASFLARRLRVHTSTIQGHLSALHRKGWLQTPNSPVSLRRRDR